MGGVTRVLLMVAPWRGNTTQRRGLCGLQGTWTLDSKDPRRRKASHTLHHRRPLNFTDVSAAMMEWRVGVLPKSLRYLIKFRDLRASLGREECQTTIETEFPIIPIRKLNLKERNGCFVYIRLDGLRVIPPTKGKTSDFSLNQFFPSTLIN